MNGDRESNPCLAAITFRSDLSVSPSQTFTSSVSFSRRFMALPIQQVLAIRLQNHLVANPCVKQNHLSAFLLTCMSLEEFHVLRPDKNTQLVHCIPAYAPRQMHSRNKQLQIRHHYSCPKFYTCRYQISTYVFAAYSTNV